MLPAFFFPRFTTESHENLEMEMPSSLERVALLTNVSGIDSEVFFSGSRPNALA